MAERADKRIREGGYQPNEDPPEMPPAAFTRHEEGAAEQRDRTDSPPPREPSRDDAPPE